MAETSEYVKPAGRDDHYIRALDRCTRGVLRRWEEANGKVSGSGGAAQLLGLKPTTLISRIKALGIARSNPGKWEAADCNCPRKRL
jgi:transcriptional regulator with GAF, ATPase, and Fis domain